MITEALTAAIKLEIFIKSNSFCSMFKYYSAPYYPLVEKFFDKSSGFAFLSRELYHLQSPDLLIMQANWLAPSQIAVHHSLHKHCLTLFAVCKHLKKRRNMALS